MISYQSCVYHLLLNIVRALLHLHFISIEFNFHCKNNFYNRLEEGIVVYTDSDLAMAVL